MFGDQGTISGYYTGKQTVLNKIKGTLGGLATIYTLAPTMPRPSTTTPLSASLCKH